MSKSKIDKLLDLVVALETNPRSVTYKLNKKEHKKYVINRMIGEYRCVKCNKLTEKKYLRYPKTIVCDDCLNNTDFIYKLKVKKHE